MVSKEQTHNERYTCPDFNFFLQINVNISTGIKKYARVSEIHIWKKSLLSIERAACRTLIYDPQHAQS